MSRHRDGSRTEHADQRWRQEGGPLALRGVLGRGRIAMAIIMAGLAFFAYSGSRKMQAIIPEETRIQLGPQHETALGRKSFQRLESAYGGLTNDMAMRETVDRIGRGTLDVPACCVSILATIQPGPLQSYLFDAVNGGKGDDGLMRLANGEDADFDASQRLISGALEASNVNVVKEMVDMIELSRRFELQVKMMQKAEKNAESAASILRPV